MNALEERKKERQRGNAILAQIEADSDCQKTRPSQGEYLNP